MLPAAAQAGSKNEPNDLIGQQPCDQVVAQGRLAASTKRDLNCLVPRLLPEGVLKLILI